MSHPEAVNEILAQDGVAVNQASDDGKTPLGTASTQGHHEVAQALLEHEDVAVNQAIADGESPLYLAACAGYLKVVKALMAHIGRGREPGRRGRRDTAVRRLVRRTPRGRPSAAGAG